MTRMQHRWALPRSCSITVLDWPETALALLTNELKEVHSQTWNNMQRCSVDFLMKLNGQKPLNKCDPEYQSPFGVMHGTLNKTIKLCKIHRNYKRLEEFKISF